jgi:hypothetical protein
MKGGVNRLRHQAYGILKAKLIKFQPHKENERGQPKLNIKGQPHGMLEANLIKC